MTRTEQFLRGYVSRKEARAYADQAVALYAEAHAAGMLQTVQAINTNFEETVLQHAELRAFLSELLEQRTADLRRINRLYERVTRLEDQTVRYRMRRLWWRVLTWYYSRR